ncbi:MAG: hypothetical protein U1E59_12385 [Amaricoccus sp.]
MAGTIFVPETAAFVRLDSVLMARISGGQKGIKYVFGDRAKDAAFRLLSAGHVVTSNGRLLIRLLGSLEIVFNGDDGLTQNYVFEFYDGDYARLKGSAIVKILPPGFSSSIGF